MEGGSGRDWNRKLSRCLRALSCALTGPLSQAARAQGVDCLVAPYEADAQLAYLSKAGIVQAVITEDSDLLAFGCKKVLKQHVSRSSSFSSPVIFYLIPDISFYSRCYKLLKMKRRVLLFDICIVCVLFQNKPYG